jgi:hypothetical protein
VVGSDLPGAFEFDDFLAVFVEFDVCSRAPGLSAVLDGDEEERADGEGQGVPLGGCFRPCFHEFGWGV